VFARSGDGEACPIGAPPDAEGLSDQVAKLLRGVDLLLNSQRVIDRNLQTVLTAKSAAHAEPVVAALGRMAEPPAGTQARITAVERFVVRLDQHLSRLSSQQVKSPVVTRQIPSTALWALGSPRPPSLFRSPGADCDRIQEPLIRDLLRDGVVRPDPLRLGLDVTGNCALLNRQGAISRRLFAVGPVTKGTFWERTAVPDIRRQTEKLAEYLVGLVKTAPPATPR
jgi:hypothetical protein